MWTRFFHNAGKRSYHRQPPLTFQMAAWAKGRDCFGLCGEGRFEIPKPPWRASDRVKTGTTAFDTLRNNLKRAAARTRKVKEKTARRRHLIHACSVNQHRALSSFSSQAVANRGRNKDLPGPVPGEGGGGAVTGAKKGRPRAPPAEGAWAWAVTVAATTETKDSALGRTACVRLDTPSSDR
jgi:hypothetical protein